MIFSAFGSKSMGSKTGGTDPLLRQGYDVFSVQTNNDDWHQSIYPEGIERLAKVIENDYSTAYGYGSSMGGFGALLYGKLLNLKTVLALSPQYTISEPFDQRWREFDKAINWVYTMNDALRYDGNVVIYYDPFDLDAKHARLFINNFKSARVVDNPVKFGSHPVTPYFHDAGELKKLLLGIPKGELIFNSKSDTKNNKTYLRQLSIHLLKRNKPISANSVIMKAIELGDERHSTYRQASDVLMAQARYEEAIEYLRKAIDAQDCNDELRENHTERLALLMQLNGDTKGAISTVNALIAKSPENIPTYLTKANICIDLDQFAEANSAILKAIELGDDRHSTYRTASNTFFEMKLLNEAIQFAKKAVAAPDNSDVSRGHHMEHLANMMRLGGDKSGAITVLNELIAASPHRNSAYIKIATLNIDIGDLAEAKQAVLKAIDNGDESQSTYAVASNVFGKMKLYDKAIEYAEKAVESLDNSDDSHKINTENLARMMRMSGDCEGAKVIVNKLITASPEWAPAHMTKFHLCMEMRQNDEAAVAVIKAIELGDERHSTYGHASNVLSRMKRYSEAVTYAQKAIAAKDNTDDSRKRHTDHLMRLNDDLINLDAANDATLHIKIQKIV